MKHKKFISLIVLFLALGTLLTFQATRESSALVLLPSELGSAPQKKLNRIRVAGRVAADSISYQLEPDIRLSFKIQNPPAKIGSPQAIPGVGPLLDVVYLGLKPDMFAPGRDVLIDGEYSDGVLHATKLLTQCPSKYEPPKTQAAALK